MKHTTCDKCGYEYQIYLSSIAYQDGQREHPVRVVIGDDRWYKPQHECSASSKTVSI